VHVCIHESSYSRTVFTMYRIVFIISLIFLFLPFGMLNRSIISLFSLSFSFFLSLSVPFQF